MNKKNYNSYLVLGVIVVVVVFLFVFGMLNGNKEDPLAEGNLIDGEITFVEDDNEENETDTDEAEPTISTELTDHEILNALITDFNNAWITYVNEDSTDVLNYVEYNSDIHYDIMVFEKIGLTEELLEMTVNDIQVEGDIAYIYNYEKFRKVRDGVETLQEYDWVYTAKKVNGAWLLDSFAPIQ